MVTTGKLFLAIIACVLMLGVILAMAFIPDNTHDFCVKDVTPSAAGEVPC